jgi:hypothetical protein
VWPERLRIRMARSSVVSNRTADPGGTLRDSPRWASQVAARAMQPKPRGWDRAADWAAEREPSARTLMARKQAGQILPVRTLPVRTLTVRTLTVRTLTVRTLTVRTLTVRTLTVRTLAERMPARGVPARRWRRSASAPDRAIDRVRSVRDSRIELALCPRNYRWPGCTPDRAGTADNRIVRLRERRERARPGRRG